MPVPLKKKLSYKHYCTPLSFVVAGGLVVFSAVSRVSSFEEEADNDAEDLVGAGQEKEKSACFSAP